MDLRDELARHSRFLKCYASDRYNDKSWTFQTKLDLKNVGSKFEHDFSTFYEVIGFFL